jgi:translation initiation factor 2 alpha subunit (eIF-2alpha)
MEYEKGDIVLCVVESISGTTVFIETKNGKKGTIVLSEIAPGRIRNLRDYVVPKKTIVCKILGKKGENLELSLRRVSPKEKKEILAQEKIEKSYRSILKSVLKEKTKEIIEKIEAEQPLSEFLEQSKKDSKNLEKIIGKENSEKVLNILKKQKSKKTDIRKKIELSTQNPQGLNEIKKIFEKIKDAKIKYIAAGKYSILVEEDNPKKANQKMKDIVKKIKDESLIKGFEFNEK